MIEHWHTLSREIVESPSSKIFESHLDMALVNLLQMFLLDQEDWTRQPPEMPSNLNYSVILSTHHPLHSEHNSPSFSTT